MALAGDQDHVAGSGLDQGAGDGRGPVRLHDERSTGPATPATTVLDDGVGVLGARVVGGHHRHVGEAGRGRTHERTLVVVPVTSGPEHDQDPATG